MLTWFIRDRILLPRPLLSHKSFSERHGCLAVFVSTCTRLLDVLHLQMATVRSSGVVKKLRRPVVSHTVPAGRCVCRYGGCFNMTEEHSDSYCHQPIPSCCLWRVGEKVLPNQPEGDKLTYQYNHINYVHLCLEAPGPPVSAMVGSGCYGNVCVSRTQTCTTDQVQPCLRGADQTWPQWEPLLI